MAKYFFLYNFTIRGRGESILTDVFDQKKRSEIMSHVKSNGNKSTEERLLKIFKQYGVKGWRRQYKIFGKPDFVFPKRKIAIFLDGCFWHGHDCRNTRPEQHAEYWEAKRRRNMERDIDVTAHLQKIGWTVIRIWECELKKKNADILLNKLDIVIDRLNKK